MNVGENMVEQEKVFQFLDPGEYLLDVLEEKKKINSRFSIRAWARQLGYKNPDLLAKVLRGERKIKNGLSEKILDTLKLSEKGKQYFKILVLLSNSSSVTEKELYLSMLKNFNPQKPYSSLTVDQFRYIADWYHMAILEMTRLKDFNFDYNYIAKRLRGSLSKAQIQNAIDRLIRLELLVKDEKGSIKKVSDKALHIGGKVPSEAVRKYHEQMIQKAVESLKEQSFEERSITSSVLTVRKKDMKKAKELIIDFHNKMLELVSNNKADDVYQLNVQMFKLTERGLE